MLGEILVSLLYGDVPVMDEYLHGMYKKYTYWHITLMRVEVFSRKSFHREFLIEWTHNYLFTNRDDWCFIFKQRHQSELLPLHVSI